LATISQFENKATSLTSASLTFCLCLCHYGNENVIGVFSECKYRKGEDWAHNMFQPTMKWLRTRARRVKITMKLLGINGLANQMRI
jgi:hypothetical protein